MDVLHPQKPPQYSSSSSSSSSRLNPDAPIFVPMKCYQTVEDFSDQWWDLVHSSPFFRDYWLQDCFDETNNNNNDDLFNQNDYLDLPDFDVFFNQYLPKQAEEKQVEEKKENKEVISMAALKWSESSGKTLEVPKYFEKAPKYVNKNVKVSPRTIHQPR